MLIRYGYEISVECAQPTAMVTLLGLRDGRERQLRMAESFFTAPQIDTSSYRDVFDNICRRFVAPAGLLTLWSDSVIEDSGAVDPVSPDAVLHAVADLPDDCLVYLMGSRYCETDRLSQIAWDRFGHIQQGWARVQAVCDFVHGHIAFDYKTASSTRTAYEVYEGRVGVCRDYAHLAVALCRCLNIPTRYVNGYLGDIGVPRVDPMDFSAWIEVYLGDTWWAFDPRNNIPRIGRIVIAHGRDAADVAMLTSFGPHLLKGFRVWAYETEANNLPGAIIDTTGAAGREVRARSPL
jgi:transglutaminase-like putative cysteine protease